MNTLLLDYWRQSIADTQRLSPPISGANVHEIEAICIKDGFIPSEIAEQLVAAHRQEIRRKNNEFDVDKIKAAPVAVTPFVLLEKLEHTQARKLGQKSEAAAVWIACSVNETGQLSPNPDFAPWIDRASLEPVGTRSFVVGTVENVDAFLETNKLPEAPTWKDIYSYTENFWNQVTEKDLLKPEFENHPLGKGRIALFSEQKAAGANLIELCDKLRDYELEANTAENTTLHTLLTAPGSEPSIAPESLSKGHIKQHVGHIGEHTLASSQRQALASVLESRVGDIVAVNGPPGTGKTTLVQSILASCVVQAALEGDKPFTMLACSTNNQAVTNLVDSLTVAAKPTENDLISDRWIPEASSLGLYFASQGARKRNSDGKYLFAGMPQHSFPDEIENREFVDQAKITFLEKAKAYFNDETLSFSAVGETLHKHLKEIHTAFNSTVDDINVLTRLRNTLIESGYPNHDIWQEKLANDLSHVNEELSVVLQEKSEEQRKIEQQVQQALSLRRRVQSQASAANLIEMLLGFLPDIKRRKIQRAILTLETAGFHEDCAALHNRSATLIDVDKTCEEIVARAKHATVSHEVADKLKQLEETAHTLTQQINEIEHSKQSWSQCWTNVIKNLEFVDASTCTAEIKKGKWNSLQSDYSDKPQEVYELLDTCIRRRMFFVALRYWESRWLLSAEDLTPEDRKRQGQKYVQERFERYAMLTPCFVATFHKAAAVFRHYGKTPELEGRTSKLEERPMGGFFDMLVVDEAGQVAPEIGAPCFYLAKRAAIVGDVLQIPPVVTLNKFVDHGNLSRAGLLDQSDELEESGYISTTGNIMQMARSRTSVTLEDVQGLFLSEHRRCYDEVIAYCNTFYNGKLLPKRGPSDGYLPPIGYAHIDGTAERVSGSWTNVGEARATAKWVAENADRFQSRYGKPIHEIVAIVTPFRRQANLIINELEKANLTARPGKTDAITVGTVHSLQGAERPIILFSSVYDRTVKTGYFFDSEHSMLNVAVSRAKDSFIVFGDMHIFKPQSGSHSGQLGKLMFAKETNEIADIITPQALIAKTNGKLGTIADLTDHRKALIEAFQTARERLLIYSPFLSINALRADNIPSLIKDTLARKVEVTIVTCEENHTSSGKRAREAVEELQQAGVEVTLLSRIHNKTLAVDSRKIIEGSFNWLSASRDSAFANNERSFFYGGDLVEDLINSAWQDLKQQLSTHRKKSV